MEGTLYLSLFFSIDAQPQDFFDYYGFSHYARELNELTPELEAVLPPTDTRFRPDQRFRAFVLVCFSGNREIQVLGFQGAIVVTLCRQAPGAWEGGRGR